MTLMTILSQAQGGSLFAATAKALGLPEASVQAAMQKLAPAIAAAMQAKAQGDADFADDLSDLLADHADGGVIDDAAAFADGQSLIDGAALLTAVYGSSDATLKALPFPADVPAGSRAPLAALSAVAVVGAMAKAQEAAASPAVQASVNGGDIISTLISELIRGAVQAALNKFLPRRRRYTDYLGRKRVTRKSGGSASPSLNDIFGSILRNVVKQSI